MYKILHLLFFTLVFNGCGYDFNINDRSDRRSLRSGKIPNETSDGQRPLGDDSQTSGQQQENSADATVENNNNPPPVNDDPADNTPPDNPNDNSPPALDPAAGGDPNIVVFRIKAGTGTGRWNSEQEMIRARVGQTIRFVNDDTVRHRLHTNGAPCAHGSDFAPGAMFDCVVSRTYSSTNSGALYDHNNGTSAEVWIETTNANATFSLADINETEVVQRPGPGCGDH